MFPALTPGEEFVTTDSKTPGRGSIVAFEHPHRDGFWMVKRLVAVEGDTLETGLGLDAGEAWVLSDNARETRADSRTFGPVPIDGLMPVVTALDEATFMEAVELLVAEDGDLERAVATFGVPVFWQRKQGFETLVLLILEQQVSLESGAAMYRRLQGLLGPVTPETIAEAGVDALREIGVTRQKAGYLVQLADDVRNGALSLEALVLERDDDARETLMSIRGVGRWTAEAYLLSALRRPDIFPAGDRALQVGTGEVLGLKAPPDGDDLGDLSQPWRPIRAAAARIIWHAYLQRRGRVEPPDPTGEDKRGEKA